jgi:uncharacterized iron-regulated protein
MIKAFIIVVASCMALQAWSAEQIIATVSQTSISQAELIEHLKQQDLILLGEVHDAPVHHLHRASLIKALASLQPVVVAEQLEAHKQVRYTGHLLEDISEAGFNAQVWDFTLYSPLFAMIAENNLRLIGGNLPIAQVREISKQGQAAVPPMLSQTIASATLTDEGKAQLTADLEAGHCGHLPKQYVANFILAQRARDASMLNAMLELMHRPVILLAGNGHVRKDYGIPTLLNPQHQKLVSIGFLQIDTLPADAMQAYQQQYDYVWLTGSTDREDPCVAFK